MRVNEIGAAAYLGGMETLLGLGALWVTAATALTLALSRAAAADEPFRLGRDSVLAR